MSSIANNLGKSATSAAFAGGSAIALTMLPFNGNPFRVQGTANVPVLGNKPAWVGIGLSVFLSTLVGEMTASTILPPLTARIPALSSVFGLAANMGPAMVTGIANYGVMRAVYPTQLATMGGFNAGLLGFLSHMIGVRAQQTILGNRVM